MARRAELRPGLRKDSPGRRKLTMKYKSQLALVKENLSKSRTMKKDMEAEIFALEKIFLTLRKKTGTGRQLPAAMAPWQF
jgi:hypothetical protein